jgi:phage terminase large subunit-like protein
VRVALVAASLDEARRVMVEGPSGILAVARAGEVLEWSFQRRRILFASGAEATLFSGAHPEGLRGPEHDFAWCDELAKWRRPVETWDNLQLGLRRGRFPRALVTTTPRRGEALRRLLGEDKVVRTGGASAVNPHLPEGWVEAQAARLGSGLLKRQELDGELIGEVKGALWTRQLIELCRGWPSPAPVPVAAEEVPYLKRNPRTLTLPPAFAEAMAGGPLPLPPAGEGLVRVVIGVDPPASEMGDACGIVACGLGEDGVGYVLQDCSVGGLSPEGWARKVAAAAEAWGAQRVVAEANNGGDMIAAVLRAAARDLPVKLVRAHKSKVARAAVAAALFEGGKAKFAGAFPALEDELAGLSYDLPYQGPGRSPDRADAMVWALTELVPGVGREPGVRSL